MVKFFVFAALLTGMVSCSDNGENLELYQFDETRKLVSFVEDAADLLKTKGKAAFVEFGKKDSKWLTGTRYLFVYELDGKCYFHPVTPELVGKCILSMQDLNGKPMIREIVKIAADSLHPYGWVHYLWMEPGELYPEWKSSFVVRVKDPSGHVYALGSGNYNQKMEKVFVSDMVDSACRLLVAKGLDAIPMLIDRSGNYYCYDSFVFILDMNGTAHVDPSFPNLSGRNLISFKDAIGKPIIREMIEKMKSQETAWFSYMSKSVTENRPTKKLAYIRRIVINGTTYIVGSSFRLEKPVWLKI